MKLSIIVPIYNVSQYLRKCVDSLLAQDLSLSDYEIILVDDGSTDDSGAIADEYVAQYNNIQVFHQTNAGLSAARNAGIAVAKGEYIMFVDSDDYLETNVLNVLLAKMVDDNLDVLRYNYQTVNEEYNVYNIFPNGKHFVDYRDEICNGLTFLIERLGHGCYAVMFIIRRCLLCDTLFKVGVYFEDTEWTPRMLVKAKRTTSLDTIVYNYLIRKGSITQAIDPKKKEKLLHDKLLLIQSLQEQASMQQDKRWYEGMIAHTVLSILGTIAYCSFFERKKILREIDDLHVYPLSYFHSTRKVKCKLQLINVSPMIYCWFLKIKNK